MNAIIFSIFFIGICIAVSLAGMVIVRKTVSAESLKDDHDVTTALLAVLGTLYAIVLGLVVVDALSHREQAQIMESNEANALATVMHLVSTLPLEKRRPVMLAELNYCNATVDVEWSGLGKGMASDPTTVAAFDAVWRSTSSFDPQTNRETDIHNSLLGAMTEFSNARRYRVVACRHGLPPLLWVILITGGICTVSSTYLFAGSPRLQGLLTAIVSLMLSLNILLVYFYSSPYRGDFQIEPSNLAHVRKILLKSLAEDKALPALEPASTK